MTQQQAASATPAPQTLAFGFCVGTAPTKWLRRWSNAGYPAQVQATPLKLGFFEEVVEPAAALTAAPVAAVLTAGGVCLLRTCDGERPTHYRAAELHSVLLYQEEFGVLVAKDSDAAALGSVQDLAEFALLRLFSHPWHLPEFPAATPWQDPSWMPTSVTAIAQLAATGTAGALLPLPLARQIADKKQHRVLPVEPGLITPRSAIWACWLRSKDSPLVQDFIGVLRGRGHNSSRTVTSGTKNHGSRTAGSTAGSKKLKAQTGQHKTPQSKTPGGKTTRGQQARRRRSNAPQAKTRR